MAIYKEKSLQKEARNLRFYSFRPLFPSLKKKKKENIPCTMIPRSWGGRSTRRKESSTRAGFFHLSKFPSTSAKWNIDTCIEPREDRISDDDKKRRERKEIFYIWRTLYPGYGGSRTMITRRRTLDCSISRVNRSAPVFRLNSPREMEKQSFVRWVYRFMI